MYLKICDARNPLFFRCEDLENYVNEVSKYKGNFLLLNKADLLEEDVRKEWNRYFLKHNV